MAKKEKEPQIEAKPQPQSTIDHFQKLYKDISDEIVHLTEELEYEVQWLEQHCQKIIANCESEWHLCSLVELRNSLEKTRNELRRESYSLLYGSKCTKYFYGEISEDELIY
jgi:hypothetical protein